MKDERDKEKAMAKLLARTLRRGLDASEKNCPDPGILAAYYDRSLSATERARWEAHFSSCACCQQQLAALARSGSRATQAAEGRATTHWPAAAGNWRWLAPALGGALGAGALWIALRPAPPRLGPPSPQPESRIYAPAAEAPASSGAPEELAKNLPAPAAAKIEPRKKAGKASAELKQKEVVAGRFDRLEQKTVEAIDSSATREDASRALAQTNAVAPAGRGVQDEKAKDKQELAAQREKDERFAVAQPKSAGTSGIAGTVLERQAVEKTGKENLEGMQSGPRAASAAPPPKQPAYKVPETQSDAADHQRMLRPFPGRTLALRSSTVLVTSPKAAVLWRLGPAGTIERSSDGGTTWAVQTSGVEVELAAGSAPSEKVCWVVGRAGTVLRTTDGEHWEKLPSPAPADLVGVKARDAWNATVIAADERVYLTSDGGQSWRAK